MSPLRVVVSVAWALVLLAGNLGAQEKNESEIPPALERARQRAAMPSPLDALSASAIPALERFDSQPKELVAVLGEHRGRQGSTAQAVAFSPDGKLLVSGGGNGLIRIWERATMRQRGVLGVSGSANRLAFFADGKTLACASGLAAVYLWDMTAKEPKLFATLQKGSTAYNALAISKSGKYVAAAGADSIIRLWTIGERAQNLVGEFFSHTAAVTGLAFAPDSKMFASSSNDGTIRLWSITADKVHDRTVLHGHKKEVTCVAFSESGTLASAGSDGTVRIWNLNASPPREKTIIPLNAGSVTALAFGPPGTLASAHSDYSVRLWTLGNAPRQRSLLEGHASYINDVAFPPSKTRISEVATASSDWTVRLWPTSGPKPRDKTIKHGHWSHTYAVDFAPDAGKLVSGSYDTSVRLWDLDGKAAKEELVWKKDPIQTYTIAFTPDGKGVAYGGSDTAVRLWEPARRWIARKFVGHPGQVSALTFSPDGKRLATCSANSIRLFDAATGQAEREITGHTKTVNALSFSPDGRYLLSGAGNYEYKDNLIVVVNGKAVYADCTARLWDADSGKELFNMKGHEFPIQSVAFAPDGRSFAYGTYENTLSLCELAGTKPGKERKLQNKGYGYGYWVQFAPDGKTLVSVGIDGKVILWDPASGKRLREWTFNEVTYRAVFAPDSRHLAVPLGTGVVYVLRLEAK